MLLDRISYRAVSAFFLMVFTLSAPAADWPQWGCVNNRNMISQEKGLPLTFEADKDKAMNRSNGGAKAENVKWIARLGSFTYGNPTVSDGRVYVGTDVRALSGDSRFKLKRGGLIRCLDETTGKILWQLAIPERKKLPPGTHFGQQHLGVCSSVTVKGDRAYVVTSAADIVCLDVHGLANGNDGPFTDEARYMAESDDPPVKLDETLGDIIWRFDPVTELGVYPHDAASSSILIVGQMLYAGTSNGMDKAHKKVLAPLAPSLVVLDKKTGRLVATDNEEIGTRLYHAAWASPSAGQVNGKTLIFFGGGDGVCYAFEALKDIPVEPVHVKKVWSYDCNPQEYKYRDGKLIPYYEGDKRKSYSTNKNEGKYIGPSQIISTPVFYEGRVYVPLGQDPAHGRGKGMFHCIDASKTGDITKTGRVWTYDGMDRSLATAAIADGLVYATDVAGRLHCLDADTGECCWVHETGDEAWGGPLVADGKLYFGNKKNFYIMTSGKKPKMLCKRRMSAPVYSTPIAANGVLYVASNRYLCAAQVTP